MSTLVDRTGTALIVIDIQNGVVGNVFDRDGVVSRIAGLVGKAREQKAPVIWVQHADDDLVKGTNEWQIVSELQPQANEPIVHKSYNDSFEETSLETELAARGIGQLVVVGAQTEWCIRSTLHGAIARGYDALLVSDAHTTEDMSESIPAVSIIALTNRYWKWHSAPGRTAGVKSAAEVSFSN